jgi:hypothetical protein
VGLTALKYPFPFKAWLAMANDPDNTTIQNWEELHSFIWEELGLPFSDSLFVRSFNQNLPDQVNLVDHPHIGKAHAHDIIHTWGDYMHGRKRGFDREDATEAATLLKEHGISPKVWIDHASFAGNFIHGTRKGAIPKLTDSSGHDYDNFVYSLDVAHELGIRYVWNGTVTSVIGQDRELDFMAHKALSGGSAVKAVAKTVLNHLPVMPARFSESNDNRQYVARTFEDGRKMYCFPRYGTWKDADIDGLHSLIDPARIDELLSFGGTAIVYSHLGKRQSDKGGRSSHIPETTKNDLRNIRAEFDAGHLMVSSVSGMLDHLVLRDHLKIVGRTIDLRSDGIRFEKLKMSDLAGKHFSFSSNGMDLEKIKVCVDGVEVNFELRKENPKVFSIVF